jgi:NADPH:quinone reductase-like Zn-dependent oxidoreductase
MSDASITAAAPSRTMKAVVRDRYGSADVLELRDVEVPRPGEGEVLLVVRAAGLDRGAWHVMAGMPYLMRLAGFGVRKPKQAGLGSDVAGVVEEVGASVTGLRPGDAVFGTCGPASRAASFAEYAVARPDRLARMPENLSFEQAAAVPVSAQTALQALRDRARVRAGQSVLIIGASGGVGTFAVQIAKAFGADVTGVCSMPKVELVSSLGADRVIDYTREDITDDGRRYDVVLDIGGNRPLGQLRRALASDGTLVFVGGEGGDRWTGGPGPSDPRHGVVTFRGAATRDALVHRRREQRGPRRAPADDRSPRGEARHLLRRRAPRCAAGDPRPRRRKRAGQGRHHPLIVASSQPRCRAKSGAHGTRGFSGGRHGIATVVMATTVVRWAT